MEFINGTLKILYIKQYGEYLPIGCLTDNSFSESAEMLDTTVRTNTNGWTSSIPVGQSYSIDFSGLIPTEVYSQNIFTYERLKYIKRQREVLEWKIDDGGVITEFGSAYISNIGDTAIIDEFISFSCTLKGQGEPINNYDPSEKPLISLQQGLQYEL